MLIPATTFADSFSMNGAAFVPSDVAVSGNEYITTSGTIKLSPTYGTPSRYHYVVPMTQSSMTHIEIGASGSADVCLEYINKANSTDIGDLGCASGNGSSSYQIVTTSFTGYDPSGYYYVLLLELNGSADALYYVTLY